MDKKELAEKFRALRKSAGLRQEDLAANSGVSIGVIKEIESGKGNPTLDTLITISSTLGTDLGAIFGAPEGKASLSLEIQDLLKVLSQDDLEALKASAENMAELSQIKTKKNRAD